MSHGCTPAHELAKEGVTARLLDSFKTLIAQGSLTPGCKLPPERDLCRQFGVSRASLRQSLKVLDMMGVLWQRVGDGAYLSTNASVILDAPMEFLLLLDAVSIGELLETRLIVEPELAALAASRATMDDIAKLRTTLQEMERNVSNDARMIVLDIEFHRGIFEAARNRICARIFPLIHRSMMASIAITSRVVDWKHTLRFHWPVFDAINQRQPAKARKCMTEHLVDACRRRNLQALRSSIVLGRPIETGRRLQ